ncbi:MAG: hypothetical protein IT438_08985 [Phycisphaerales bacterium]|nr:hypothetical protein [Phycisphaerales bacterium]
MKPIMHIVTVLALSPLLSGCIAWEIRDEIRATNQNLCEVKPALVHTLHSVEETNQKIAVTQAQLAEIQAALVVTQSKLDAVHASLTRTDEHLTTVGGTLGQTNPKLVDLDGGLERMKVLNDVHATLKDVQAALGPLSGAMGSLGGAMSFLGLSSDSSTDLLEAEEESAAADAAPVEASAADSTAKPAAGSAADASEAGASKRPDPLLGTWVQVYPPPSAQAPGTTSVRITVVTADGRVVSAHDGQKPRSGKWTRQGRTLTFSFDPVSAGAQPEVETGELLSLNSRALTIRVGDSIRVHARP